MAEKPGRKPALTPAGRQAAEDRQQRLAAALRENLRKRKLQQRSRGARSRLSSDATEPENRDDD